MPELVRWLTLADGTGWRFHADAPHASWLRRYSEIASLRPSPPPAGDDGWPAVLLRSTPPADRSWHGPFSIGQLSLWRQRGGHDLVLRFPPLDDLTERDRLHSLWFATYTLYPGLLRQGHLPLHAGLAQWEEAGILISAPGGTGKSTALRRLPAPWEAICDDESWLISTSDGTFANPMPTWSDWILRDDRRCWDHSRQLPVRAIIYLKQAPQDQLTRLSGPQHASLLFQAAEQMLRRAWTALPPPDLTPVRARAFDLAAGYAARLPGFLLDISLHGRFWELIEREV